jgi:hypothetical protein
VDVISWPTNETQLKVCRELFRVRCGAALPPDAHYIVWLTDGQPTWIVGYYDWVGHTCQLSQANTGIRPIPRTFAREVFNYAFNVLKRKMVFAVVSAGNEQALRVNKFLGFHEVLRWPEMAKHDHDLLLLTMTREQCRFLEKQNDARYPAAA